MENNLFVGLFAIVIGLFFMVIGGLMFKLHQLQAPEIVKQVEARIPVMQRNECIDFQSYQRIVPELDDLHHVALKPYYPKVKNQITKKTMRGTLGGRTSLDEREDFDLETEGGDMFARQQETHKQQLHSM